MVRRRGGLRARRLSTLALASGLLASLVFAAPAAAVTPGDEPADAIPIATSDFGTEQPYDTTGATAGADDPAACDSPETGLFEGPFGETVWHAFTPVEDGELIVDVNSFPDPEGPGFLAILFVFGDDGAGGLDLVACNAFPATVRFAAVAGTTYYAMTGSLPESPGGGPALITVLEPFLSGLTVDPDAGYDPQTNQVIVSGTVNCTAVAIDFLEVFVDGVQEIGSHRVFGGGGSAFEECGSEMPWTIFMDGFTSTFNPGTLDVFVNVFACAGSVCVGDSTEATVRARPISNRPGAEPPPPPPPTVENDEREGAFEMAVGDVVFQDITGATTNATDPTDCPDEGSLPSNSTVWHVFTAESDALLNVNTYEAEIDTVLFVLDGDAVVACNDDAPDGTGSSAVEFEAVAGTSYHVMVGAAGDQPPGVMSLAIFEVVEPPPPPDNDERADAVELEVDGPSLEADTGGATVNFDTDPQECPVSGFPPSEHTVWYSISPDSDGWIEVNTLGSDFDTTLYVLDGDEVVACNDDAVDVSSSVAFEGVAGSTYDVMVGTFNGSPGGHLVISALTTDEPPPPPPVLEAEITFDETGSLNPRTGEVTLGGTITCSLPATGFASASASQEGGRFLAIGFGGSDVACDEETSRWSVTIVPETAKFQNGELFAYAEVLVFPEDGIGEFEFFEGIISVRPARAV
jgi:hypothetical protein